MTEKELREMEERCEAATSGPWVINAPELAEDEDGNILTGFYSYPGGIEGKDGDPVCTFGSENGSGHMFENEWNKVFIAHSRTDLPRLIEAYREQRKELELVALERNVLINNFLSEHCPAEYGYDVPWCERKEQCGETSCDFGVEKCWRKWAECEVLSTIKGD